MALQSCHNTRAQTTGLISSGRGQIAPSQGGRLLFIAQSRGPGDQSGRGGFCEM